MKQQTYFKPDSTGFYLATHSWRVLKNPPGINNSKTSIGKTVLGTKAASDYARQFFQEIAENKKLEIADNQLYKQNLIQAAENNNVLEAKSWRLEGKYKKTGIRPQTVSSDWEQAISMLKDARNRELELSERASIDLITLKRTREVLAVEETLEKRNWTLPQLVKHGEATDFDPNLPEITLTNAVEEYLNWAEVQTATPVSQDNTKTKMSIHTLRSHRRFLNMLCRYHKPETTLAYLKNGAKIQAFCTGNDPIPLPTIFTYKQRISSGKSAYGRTKRPWSVAQSACCASAITSLLEWAATPGIPHPGGILKYLSPINEDTDLWFPEIDDEERYLLNAKTANVYEYRSWVDTAWPTRFAARVCLETFAGLRPSEINAPDSFINWDECYFWVGRSCKTGHRIVPLMNNIMLMLFFLRAEGRLYLNWKESRDKTALTVLHAKMGYLAADCLIERDCGSVALFRENYPVKYYIVTNKETGRDELAPWGYYTKKCARHSFGSVVYEASMRNAGLVAGILGHRESTFLDDYAGKVHAELWSGSTYRACVCFCQCLPKQLRALGIRERDMQLPDWFLRKPDDTKAANRARLMEIVDIALTKADESTRRQADAIAKNKTFITEINQLAALLGVDRGTIRKWVRMDGFPTATSNGFILEDIKEWSIVNNQPACSGIRASKLKRMILPDGKTVIPRWVDLAKELRVNVNTLKGNWANQPGFPKKTPSGYILEEIAEWIKTTGHVSPSQHKPAFLIAQDLAATAKA